MEHPLIATAIAETNHVLSKAGRERCEGSAELCPGQNACAVCAKPESTTTVHCKHCAKVAYCGKEHAARDSAVHMHVCKLLQCIAASEDVCLESDEQAQLLSEFECTTATGADSWEKVLPARLQESGRTSKRTRHATPSPAPGEKAETGSTDGDFLAPTQLLPAAQIAVATSFLSYPYSLCRALRAVPCLKQAVQTANAAQRPLVVAVLGASEGAELLHPQIWSLCLEGVAEAGLVLQFVGPEVGAERHLQVQTLSESVQLVSYKGEYNALVDHLLVATQPLTQLEPLSPRAGATGVKAGKGAAASHEGKAGGAFRASVLPDELRALPDVAVGYNMGLTCPDYDWRVTLRALRRVFKSKCDVSKGRSVALPWLQTSNTMVEGLMEQEMMGKAGWGAAPGGALLPNPFSSLQPLQSGTLANDLYRKNAWVAAYLLQFKGSKAPPPAQAAVAAGNVPAGGARSSSKAALKLREALRRGLGVFSKGMGTLLAKAKSGQPFGGKRKQGQ